MADVVVPVMEKVSVWFDDDVTFEGSVSVRRVVPLNTSVHVFCYLSAVSERIDDEISLPDAHTKVVALNDYVDCLVMETDVNVHVDDHVMVNDQNFCNTVPLILSAR